MTSILKVLKTFSPVCQRLSTASGMRDLPVILNRKLQFPPPSYVGERQAWLETLDSLPDQKIGIVDLHPDVFGIVPRIDIIHACVVWQKLYRQIV